MGRFIWILITLVLSVWLGLQIAQDPGLALFTYKQWSAEMPLWFAVLCFILLVFIGYFILSFLGRLDTAFYRWKNWLRWRRKAKAYSKTNRGLIELIERHWKNAEYYLLEGLPQSDAPLINYLALAKAAQELGEDDKRDNYLRQAYASSSHAEIAIGLTQSQLQLQRGQMEQALATLTHLRQIAPHHAAVLKSLERIYVQLEDWKNVLMLLPHLYKADVINKEQHLLLQQKTYQQLFLSLRPAHINELRELWRTVPRKLTKDPDVIYGYAKQLLSFPYEDDEVEILISNTLAKIWHKELVKLYGLLVTSDAKLQLVKAEAWLKRYPNQAVLLLTLSRLCVRCQLWGKARSYFADSLALEASAETYIDYGKLLERLGDTSTAMKSYYDGLMLCRK